jgi:hypothetical protein
MANSFDEPSVFIRNEGSVGADRGQWAIPMNEWVNKSRAVVLIKTSYGPYCNGSIVKHADVAESKSKSDYYLLTANHFVKDLEDFKDSSIFFDYDDGLDTRAEQYRKVSGKELSAVESDSECYTDKEFDYSMFPVRVDKLREAFRLPKVDNEHTNDDIPHLMLSGVDMAPHMVLYIIHHTDVKKKYRKCMNSRFAMPDTGYLFFHSVTTYKSSVGAPVFTVWMDKNDVPYLRFVGMHLGNKDLPLKTKVLITLAPIMEKGKKHENTTNVEINVGIKTNMIEKKLRNELKPNEFPSKFHLPSDLTAQLYMK